MKKSVKFSPEFRERAVRMVAESRVDHPSLWSAVESIAAKIGCTPQTLLTWVRQHEREPASEKDRPRQTRSASKNRSAESRSCAMVQEPPRRLITA
ncbi:transposase [Dechloromonas denitrificans]|nr:transposase [Dechloromonas denitrificans]